ncbi:MAG: hypothetical protein ACLQGV_03810 [Bryobacteraceae bacterium]
MAEYTYQPVLNEVDYEAACIRLRERVLNRMEPGWANNTSPGAIAAVMERLCRYEAPVVDQEVGRGEHQQ